MGIITERENNLFRIEEIEIRLKEIAEQLENIKDYLMLVKNTI